VKYAHKQNIARTTANTASLMSAPQVMKFMAKILLYPDFGSAVFSPEFLFGFNFCFLLNTNPLSVKRRLGQGVKGD
jgi:hypothetical protein